MKFFGTHQLADAELMYSKRGTLPPESGVETKLFALQTHDWDARKAEALSVSEKLPDLMRARSFLMRGKLNEAAEIPFKRHGKKAFV